MAKDASKDPPARTSKQRQEDEDKGKNEGKTYGQLKHEQENAHREHAGKKWWQK